MDKALLDAIETATRVNRMLDGANGFTSLVEQAAKARQALNVYENLASASALAKRIDALQAPNLLSVNFAFQQEMDRLAQMRRTFEPDRSLIDSAIGRVTLAEQLETLPLPQLDQTSLAAFHELEQAQKAARLYEAAFHPSLSLTKQLADQVAMLTEPHRRFATGTFDWSDSLAARMGVIDRAWALHDNFAVSGLAFGHLAQFSDVVRYDSPFAPDTNEVVLEELGEVIVDMSDDTDDREVQYDAAGRNPSLIAFPEDAYPSVVRAAGFTLVIPPAPVPIPIANAEPVAYVDADHAALREVEAHMRSFVEARLFGVAGPRWMKQRVPGPMLSSWKERQQVDRDQMRPVFPLIYYADFNDLAQIIVRADNWRELFEPVFQIRENVTESLRRLSPIRNADAHGRPLSQTDVLYIAAEGTRLLRAIGVLRFPT